MNYHLPLKTNFFQGGGRMIRRISGVSGIKEVMRDEKMMKIKMHLNGCMEINVE
jgi:hypothetical protein